MKTRLYALIMMLVMYSLLSSSPETIFANQSSSLNSSSKSTATGFSDNLKSKIQDLIINAINDTDNTINSTNLLSNGSNLSSSNIVISKNKVTSTINSNNSISSSSIIKDQVKTINGICSSIKVGGNGNDTLASTGKCNDVLTGGLGADKFMCGDGNDTVRDYNPKEGDTILDQQNCEKIL